MYGESTRDLSRNSPDQEQALREAIDRISKRIIAKNPNGFTSKVEKLLEELRRREVMKDQE